MDYQKQKITMKQIIRFIAIAVLSAAIAGACAYVLADTLRQFAAIFFFGGLFIALVMGAFSEREKASYGSIRHHDGRRRSYGQAAVFIGSACLFMGTLQECEEVADDLWHYAQNARVEMLDNVTDFEIL